jgi:putative spermidine/putrescine transport system permease protein
VTALLVGRIVYRAINALVLFFLLAPLAVVVVFAVNPTPFIQFPPIGVTGRWFAKFFASPDFMNSLALSLEVAAATVVLAMLVGASAALAIARGGLPGARLITALFLAPLMLPAILTGLALFQLVLSLGFGRPVWALVVGHTVVAVPYVIRTTLAVLADFDRRIEEAAASLGAGPLRVFFEVTLPLIRPGVIAGGIFAFIVSFDQFPISLFLVAPNRETLPIVMFNYMKFDLDGTIAAASTVSILLALAVVLTIDRVVGLRATMKI